MTRSMTFLFAFLTGLAGTILGTAWGLPLLLVVIALVVISTMRLDSQLMGPVHTKVRDGFALTYDDGPDPESTPPLLDLLAERGAKATFFLIGDKARAHPEIVKRLVDEGHEIANHSQSHRPMLNFRLRGGMRREIGACQETLANVAGLRPRYYRPPCGLTNPFVTLAAHDLGMSVVGWNVRRVTSKDVAADDDEALQCVGAG